MDLTELELEGLFPPGLSKGVVLGRRPCPLAVYLVTHLQWAVVGFCC